MREPMTQAELETERAIDECGFCTPDDMSIDELERAECPYCSSAREIEGGFCPHHPF